MKTTFISTILNEENTIDDFLNSILNQSILPDEVIIVDGGSSDKTLTRIRKYENIFKKNCKLKILSKKGNRSVGRNEAIKESVSDIILCSDAGCILDKAWIENLVAPFKDNRNDVIAGYYQGKWENIFQKSLIPYVLVMPDKVDIENFLPASRSMAFRKSVWEKVGGFDENLTHNEDYDFAKKLKKNKLKIVFQKNALVSWMPRKNILEAFRMFYRFAFGDIEAGIIRPKVIFIFIRYLLGVGLFLYSVLASSLYVLYLLFLILFIYLLWSIYKNFKYVKNTKAFIYLPLIQLTSDIAVLSGSFIGALSYVFNKHK